MEWRGGTGKEKGNKRNRKLEFSLLYSRVLCIIGIEKKNQDFYSLSLSPHGGKLFECNLLFIKWLGFFFFLLIYLFLYEEALKRCLNALKRYNVSLFNVYVLSYLSTPP